MNLVVMRFGIVLCGLSNWRVGHGIQDLQVELCSRQNSKLSPGISSPLVYMPKIITKNVNVMPSSVMIR